jgi:hypothetical protein
VFIPAGFREAFFRGLAGNKRSFGVMGSVQLLLASENKRMIFKSDFYKGTLHKIKYHEKYSINSITNYFLLFIM